MKRLDGPSLFDDELEPDESRTDAADLEPWEEVPQARFLSWSDAMQWSYCWRRDLDAALRASTNEEAEFFLTRAAWYKEQIPHG